MAHAKTFNCAGAIIHADKKTNFININYSTAFSYLFSRNVKKCTASQTPAFYNEKGY